MDLKAVFRSAFWIPLLGHFPAAINMLAMLWGVQQGQPRRHILSQAPCLVFLATMKQLIPFFKDLRKSSLHEIAQLSDLLTFLHPHSSSSPSQEGISGNSAFQMRKGRKHSAVQLFITLWHHIFFSSLSAAGFGNSQSSPQTQLWRPLLFLPKSNLCPNKFISFYHRELRKPQNISLLGNGGISMTKAGSGLDLME